MTCTCTKHLIECKLEAVENVHHSYRKTSVNVQNGTSASSLYGTLLPTILACLNSDLGTPLPPLAETPHTCCSTLGLLLESSLGLVLLESSSGLVRAYVNLFFLKSMFETTVAKSKQPLSFLLTPLSRSLVAKSKHALSCSHDSHDYLSPNASMHFLAQTTLKTNRRCTVRQQRWSFGDTLGVPPTFELVHSTGELFHTSEHISTSKAAILMSKREEICFARIAGKRRLVIQ